MAKEDVPDPTKPGQIPGQNPSTPERMPGHTAYFQDTADHAGTSNEEELGGRPAFLYRSDDWSGITLDSSGENLPARSAGWQLERYITLGIRDAIPADATPEQILAGIQARGFYVWKTGG